LCKSGQTCQRSFGERCTQKGVRVGRNRVEFHFRGTSRRAVQSLLFGSLISRRGPVCVALRIGLRNRTRGLVVCFTGYCSTPRLQALGRAARRARYSVKRLGGRYWPQAEIGGAHAFFRRYDKFRYVREGHILRRLDAIDFKDKRVLEIGLGQGADSEQIIRRGAVWSGIDLTTESIARVSKRLRLRQLPYQHLECASALALPFADNSFDIVFSHGVLHHIPDVKTAQREIARVLKPDGELIAMLYARRSLNYLVAIAVVRRLVWPLCISSELGVAASSARI
jgi:Methyltransferase domain